MGFIRGGLLTIAIIILLFSLVTGNIFFVASSSLERDNIEKHLTPVLEKIVFSSINSSNISENFEIMKTYCENENTEYTIDKDDFNISVNCEDILSGTPESVLDEEISQLIDDVYYNEYDCAFFSCFDSGVPFFLISKHTKDYLRGKFFFLLGFSVIIVLIMFFLFKDKKNLPISLGILIIISSFPFIWVNSVTKTLSNETARDIFSAILSNAYFSFVLIFILGVVILGVGVSLKFWSFSYIREKLSKTREIIKPSSRKIKK
jgi:hypothetical protein